MSVAIGEVPVRAKGVVLLSLWDACAVDFQELWGNVLVFPNPLT